MIPTPQRLSALSRAVGEAVEEIAEPPDVIELGPPAEPAAFGDTNASEPVEDPEPVPWVWSYSEGEQTIEGFAYTQEAAERALFAARGTPYPDTPEKVDEALDSWGDSWSVEETDQHGQPTGMVERARAALSTPPAETAKPPPKGRRPPAREPELGDRLVIWGTNRHGGQWEILWVPAGTEPGPDIRTIGGTYYTLFAARKAAKRAAKRYGMPLQDVPVERD